MAASRRRALDSDDEDDPGEVAGVSEATKGDAKTSVKEGGDAENSEDEERKRKEKTMRRLMALGDSSSEDERPRQQSVRAHSFS